MLLEFDPEVLRPRLSTLPVWKQNLFVLSIGERLLPNYHRFATEVGANRDFYRNALDAAWDALTGQGSEVDLKSVVARATELAPDTEAYEHKLVSAALDAASVVVLLYEFMERPEVELVVQAASLARDSVDMCVQDVDGLQPTDPSLEQKILSHDWMQRELARQSDDIDFLSSLPADRQGGAKLAKQRWH